MSVPIVVLILFMKCQFGRWPQFWEVSQWLGQWTTDNDLADMLRVEELIQEDGGRGPDRTVRVKMRVLAEELQKEF